MSLCLDEPYTEDQNMVMMSGIEVSLYSGGKLAGAASDVPPVDTGNEGDVLTIVSGEPAWAPPSGGGGGSGVTTVIGYPSPYYLYKYAGATRPLLPLHVPFVSTDFDTGVGVGDFNPDGDTFVLGSGVGTAISFALPLTTDGQFLATPRAGYAFSVIAGSDTDGSGVPQYGGSFRVDLTISGGGSTTITGRLLLGASPNTDANSYMPFGSASSTSGFNRNISFSVNTTASNSAQPTIVATLGASRTWSFTVTRYSWN